MAGGWRSTRALDDNDDDDDDDDDKDLVQFRKAVVVDSDDGGDEDVECVADSRILTEAALDDVLKDIFKAKAKKKDLEKRARRSTWTASRTLRVARCSSRTKNSLQLLLRGTRNCSMRWGNKKRKKRKRKNKKERTRHSWQQQKTGKAATPAKV